MGLKRRRRGHAGKPKTQLLRSRSTSSPGFEGLERHRRDVAVISMTTLRRTRARVASREVRPRGDRACCASMGVRSSPIDVGDPSQDLRVLHGGNPVSIPVTVPGREAGPTVALPPRSTGTSLHGRSSVCLGLARPHPGITDRPGGEPLRLPGVPRSPAGPARPQPSPTRHWRRRGWRRPSSRSCLRARRRPPHGRGRPRNPPGTFSRRPLRSGADARPRLGAGSSHSTTGVVVMVAATEAGSFLSRTRPERRSSSSDGGPQAHKRVIGARYRRHPAAPAAVPRGAKAGTALSEVSDLRPAGRLVY